MIKKSIKERIKEYFFVYPTEKLRVRQIERLVKVPLPSVIHYTKELDSEHILQQRKVAGITVYSADRASQEFLIEKRLFNIKQLHSSGLLAFIQEYFENSNLKLFGSYSRGEDTEDSDIDLYIETTKERPVELEKFERILHRKIQLFTHKNIKEIKNVDLINNILNGITLNGFVEVM